MTVHGSGMGVVAYTAWGRTGHTGCEGTVWQSETSVRCRVGHGAAGTRRVFMTAGGRGGSVTKGWSVDTAGLSWMRQVNLPGTGSASMTVLGASMGHVTYTGRAREGHTGCEGTVWESETSVRCRAGHGAGGTRRMVMTVGSRGGSTSQAWSADGGMLSRLLLSNFAGTGAGSMTVYGNSLGIVRLTAKGRMGHTGCEGSDWVSETSVRCRVAHGATATQRITMSTGQKTASFSQGWSLDVAALSRMRRINSAGTGSSSITVHGAGMGRTRLTVRTRQGPTGCEGTSWESETSVRCRMGHGAVGTRRVVMTVGGRGGTTSQGWSADTVSLSRMRRLNHADSGSASMTVHGSGMGVVALYSEGKGGAHGM
jgi:hypothetical protein